MEPGPRGPGASWEDTPKIRPGQEDVKSRRQLISDVKFHEIFCLEIFHDGGEVLTPGKYVGKVRLYFEPS